MTLDRNYLTPLQVTVNNMNSEHSAGIQVWHLDELFGIIDHVGYRRDHSLYLDISYCSFPSIDKSGNTCKLNLPLASRFFKMSRREIEVDRAELFHILAKRKVPNWAIKQEIVEANGEVWDMYKWKVINAQTDQLENIFDLDDFIPA